MNDARIGAGEEKEVGRSDCTAATHLLVLVRLLELLDRNDLPSLLVPSLELPVPSPELAMQRLIVELMIDAHPSMICSAPPVA